MSRIIVFVPWLIYMLYVVIIFLSKTERKGNNMQIFENNMTVATIICSVATIVSFIIVIWTEHKANKTNELRFNTVNKDNEDLKSYHKQLTDEHTALKSELSTEHAALKNDLGEKLNKLETRQESIQIKVFDYISNEEGRRDKVQTVLPQQDVQLQIQLLYDKIAALSEENKEVKQQKRQIAELENQVAELTQQLTELSKVKKALDQFNHQLQEDVRQLQEEINLQPQQFEKAVEDISRDEPDFYDEFGR